MPNIVKLAPADLPATLVDSVEKARSFIRDSVPPNTQRAYTSDWALFVGWCADKRVTNLPAAPQAIAAFIADASARCKPSTLRRRLAAIAKMHSIAGHPNPCAVEAVKSTMKGIERTFGVAVASKAPATHDKIEKMVGGCSETTFGGLRARAVILLGYAGAFRRSELADLQVDALKWTDDGVVITVRRSKTDQRGAGMTKAIPYVKDPLCAATALKLWLKAANIEDGYVFRRLTRTGSPVQTGRLSDHAIAEIVKEAAGRCGLDAIAFSGHSLRAGHVTEARSRGIADSSTMATTGHKRVETLDVYDRRENAFQRTSAGEILKSRDK